MAKKRKESPEQKTAESLNEHRPNQINREERRSGANSIQEQGLN